MLYWNFNVIDRSAFEARLASSKADGVTWREQFVRTFFQRDPRARRA